MEGKGAHISTRVLLSLLSKSPSPSAPLFSRLRRARLDPDFLLPPLQLRESGESHYGCLFFFVI